MLDRILIGSSAEPTDTNFKNVTLLLHGDGSNGAQNNTFIDSSTNNFTITRNGNTTQGSFSPYGSNWSNYFDGNGDYLQTPSNSAFALNGTSFTIEAWVYVTSSSEPYQHIVKTSGASNNLMYIDYSGGSNGVLSSQVGGTTASQSGVTLNTWHHLAVVRNGTSVTSYVNGVGGTPQTIDPGSSGSVSLIIATDGGPSPIRYFNGYISNLRVVKGTAVYTSNFTPPTAPLTAITNTSLLTCADNRFRDGSTNNFTITRNGDVKVTNFSPFAPSAEYSTTTNGGSAYFDGSGDYLATPTSSNLQFGTGDFTFEGWFYRVTPGTTEIPISFGGAVGAFIFTFRDSSTTFGVYGSGDFVSGAVVPSGAWTHVAVTRSSGTLRLFINGDLSASASDTTNYNLGPCYIGSVGGAYYYKGFVSNFRIVKGTAVYTAAFTPPTSPVTAITNTQLLTNFTNAAIFDNSMKNDLETVGNAQISTSVKKFGTGSIYLSAYTAYLNSPFSQTAVFGTGDFTIEAWIYSVAATAGYTCIFSSRDGIASNANAVFFGLKPNTNQMTFFTSSEIIGTSTAISTGVWTHVALVRNSGATAIYINGVSSGTATFTTSLTGTGASIGNEYNQATGYNGGLYVDDFRITKGVARYTANFTAPTAPFPNK